MKVQDYSLAYRAVVDGGAVAMAEFMNTQNNTRTYEVLWTEVEVDQFLSLPQAAEIKWHYRSGEWEVQPQIY